MLCWERPQLTVTARSSLLSFPAMPDIRTLSLTQLPSLNQFCFICPITGHGYSPPHHGTMMVRYEHSAFPYPSIINM